MKNHPFALLLFGLLASAPSMASADAPSDLTACQATVASASAQYIQSLTDAVDGCLRRMSAAVIARGATTEQAATGVAPKCVAFFRRLSNANRPRKQLDRIFNATVDGACDPAVNPDLLHTAADTYTIGQRSLGAERLAASCASLGQDASIKSFAAWRDCLRAATECEAQQAVALRWPRALEYFAALKTAIAALPADAARDDALAGLTALDREIEGAVDDDVADVRCAAPAGVLATGQSGCVDFGAGSPTYTCPTRLPGQDAFFRPGVPSRYTDNGDGTVTDLVTGLTWEKLDAAGGMHDKDAVGDWASTTSTKIDQLNGAAFAGHTDWRIPNRRELESLVNVGAGQPKIGSAFNDSCTPGCSSIECSCTATAEYWSSSVYQADADRRWIVSFVNGAIGHDDKTTGSYRVRAVRGGVTTPVAPAATMKAAEKLADTAGEQLQACQLTAADATSKYARAATRAIGACLGAMSSAVVGGGATPAQAATATAEQCATSLRRLLDTVKPKRTLAARAAATIAQSCDPSVNPGLGYDPSAVFGTGQGALGAGGLASCTGGAVTSVQGWTDCMLAAAECQVRQSVALRWPRALEYLQALKPAIAALPATAANADASAALVALDAALEGDVEDDRPQVECAPPGGLPSTGQQLCDNGDGTFANCPPTAVQQDGQQRAGVPRRFVDNGDGTISDLVTGLMWEKQDGSASGTGTDSNTYLWSSAISLFGRQALPAGYDDWRAPTRRELESLVDLGGQSPAIDPVFHHDCTPGCTLDTCACTVPGPYWSSTWANEGAWVVSFADGSLFATTVDGAVRNPEYPVRLVRGGVTDPVIKPGPPLALDVSVRNPWRSACVPVQLAAYDADSSCYMVHQIKTLPAHGFLTEFVSLKASTEANLTESVAANMCPPPEQNWMNEVVLKRFNATLCYIPFSPTFTGFDSFTYSVLDNDELTSGTATVSIEIFEVRQPGG